MTEGFSSIEARLLEANLQNIKEELMRQGRTLEGIGQSIHLLTKLEQTQIHINDRLKDGSIKLSDHENRIVALEAKMPGLIEIRRWVIGGILAGITMIGAALMKLIFIP